jgi:RecB family exonuclease
MQKYQQTQADSSLQLSIYQLAMQTILKRTPKKMRYDILIKNKNPRLQQVETKRTEDHLREIEKLVKTIDDERKRFYQKEYFPPSVNHMVCSWCGYRQYCPLYK